MNPSHVVADPELYALAFFLTAFSLPRHQFVRGAVTAVMHQRGARATSGDALAAMAPDGLTRDARSFCDAVEHEVRAIASSAPGADAAVNDLALPELKLRCFELFRRVDPGVRAELFATLRATLTVEGLVGPREGEFISQLESAVATSGPPPAKLIKCKIPATS